MKFHLVISLLTVFLMGNGECAKIFIYMGALTSHSPTASIQPLANRLAERGHDVTIFSPIRIAISHPKVRQFCPEELRKYYKDWITSFGKESSEGRADSRISAWSLGKALTDWFDASIGTCEMFINNPEVVKMAGEEKFDLFIVDNIINDCGYPLAFHFRAKIMVYSAAGTFMPWDTETFGLASELSWVPGFTTGFEGGRPSLWDRFVNAAFIFTLSTIYRTNYLPKVETLYKNSHFGQSLKGMPSLEKVIQNSSLILINQHYSDQFPISYPPYVVTVGGMHLEEPNATLPKDISKFIGNDEFIFVSFGSFAQASAMPKKIIQAFLDVFGSSKMKFLWKWEGSPPENAPNNILFQKWFPQQNILAHPKIRGFLTQGGQISMAQAICRGVPLLIFPVEGDQYYNALRSVGNGNGIKLDFVELTQPKLDKVFNRLLNDPSIAANAQKMEIACKDRPMNPVDTASFWVEWVLRTDDPSVLKPLGVGQPLWLLWSLDLWFFLSFLIFLSLTASLCLCKIVFCKLLKHSQTECPRHDKTNKQKRS